MNFGYKMQPHQIKKLRVRSLSFTSDNPKKGRVNASICPNRELVTKECSKPLHVYQSWYNRPETCGDMRLPFDEDLFGRRSIVMMIPQHESDKCVEVGLRKVGSLDV